MNYEGPHGLNAEVLAAGPSGRALASPPWFSRIPWIFVAMVGVPTIVAAVYYLLIAAPLYVSDARFVVRVRGQSQPAALGSLLQTVGVTLGQSQTDAFEVQEYMASRDALQDLAKSHAVRLKFARPEADFLERFPRPFENQSFENLYKAYHRFVTVGYDSQTGISTLEVKAFRASDARDIANALLDGGEVLINRLNDRAEADSVSQAQRQVMEAETRGIEAEATLTDFRNRERLIDPDRSSVAGLDLLSKLETQLASMRAERVALAASAPESPQLPVLDKRIAAFGAQLEAERSRTAGEQDSLAPKIGEYERLVLARDLTVKSEEAAVASLETARLDARRKQLYLEKVVSANLPDRAEQPKRLVAILTVLVSTLVAYSTLSLVIAGLREHRQQ